MWQRGQRLNRSHFLNRSLERARLIARVTQAPKPRTSLLPVQPATCLHLPMVSQRCRIWFSTDGFPCCLCGLQRPPLPLPLHPHPPLDVPWSPSGPRKGAQPSRRCREGSCAHPRPQPCSPLPNFPIGGAHTRAWDFLPPPPRQPRSKETAEQGNARTSGAPRRRPGRLRHSLHKMLPFR